jgi:hypothetical protein
MIPDRLRSSWSTCAAAPTMTTSIPMRSAPRDATSSICASSGSGIDQYAVTLSRPELDRPPGNQEVGIVLSSAFGDASTQAVERSGGASRIRMFRVPAGSSVSEGGQPGSGS